MLKIFVDAMYKFNIKYFFMVSIFKYEHLMSGVCGESKGPVHMEVDIRTANQSYQNLFHLFSIVSSSKST